MPKNGLKRKRSVVDDGLENRKRLRHGGATLSIPRPDQQINEHSDVQSIEPAESLAPTGNTKSHDSQEATTQPLQFKTYNRQCVAVRRHVPPPSLSSGLSRAVVLWRADYQDTESQKSSVQYPKPVCARPRPVAPTPMNRKVMAWLDPDVEEIQESLSQRTPSHMSDAFSIMSILPSFELSTLEECLLSVRDLANYKARAMDHEILGDLDIGKRLNAVARGVADTKQHYNRVQKDLETFGVEIGTVGQNERFRYFNSFTVIDCVFSSQRTSNSKYAAALKMVALHLCEAVPELHDSMFCQISRLLDSAGDKQFQNAMHKVMECMVDHLVVQLGHNSPALIWLASRWLHKAKHRFECLSLDHWLIYNEDSFLVLWLKTGVNVSFEPETLEYLHKNRRLCRKFLATYADTSHGGSLLRVIVLMKLDKTNIKLRFMMQQLKSRDCSQALVR